MERFFLSLVDLSYSKLKEKVSFVFGFPYFQIFWDNGSERTSLNSEEKFEVFLENVSNTAKVIDLIVFERLVANE